MDTEILREHIENRYPHKVVDVAIIADITAQIRVEQQRAFVSEQLDSFKAVLRKTGVRPRLVTGPLAVFGRGEKADAISVLAAELERLEQESVAQRAGASTNTTHAFVTFADSKASDEFQRTGRERALGDKADDNRAYVLEASNWSIKQVTAATCRKPRRTPADARRRGAVALGAVRGSVGNGLRRAQRVLLPARLRRCPTSCGRTCRSTPTAKYAPLNVGRPFSTVALRSGGITGRYQIAQDCAACERRAVPGFCGAVLCTSGRPTTITANRAAAPPRRNGTLWVDCLSSRHVRGCEAAWSPSHAVGDGGTH